MPAIIDHDDAEQQRVGLERLAAVVDHVADALAAAEHFADHDADQAERDGLADAGEDERHRARDRHGLENLPVRAQNARAALSRSASVARMPPIVLISTGKNALMKR